VRYYQGTFALTETTIRLSMAKGTAPLTMTLTRPVPYPLDQVRSVKLVNEGRRLFIDVTARVPVLDHGVDPAVTMGVDLGVIHPYAAVVADVGLLVSGRALRAEEFLHLEDSKARARKMATKRGPRRARPGRPRQAGSRRWRKMQATGQRRQRRHLRTVRQAKHAAAKAVIALAIAQRAGRIAVGDPTGLCATDHGHVANKRNRDWRPGQSIRILADKAELAGIAVERVDERGTSSHCPACGQPVPKPKGRTLSCPHCSYQGHRDLAGAHNIRARATPLAAGPVATGPTPATAITHRRAGTPPARRDRRRHLHDAARSSPAMGRPQPAKQRGSRSPTSQTGTLDQTRRPAQLRSPNQPARNRQPAHTKRGKR
jgi:putative transposase